MSLPGLCFRCRQRCPFSKRLIKIYISTYLCLFSSAFSITMLFPFLPFMVKFLLESIDDTQVGTYAGIVAFSMFFGRVFGSYLWGLVTDSWGRKRVMISSVLLMGLASLGFGFSVNYYMAIVMRFLVGITNGIVGTVKTIVSESSTDKTQAFGLSLLASAFGFGLIVGPALSGAVSDPINQYNITLNNSVIEGYFNLFPYSLPGIINFIISLIAAVVTILFLPETREKKRTATVQNGSLNQANHTVENNVDDVSMETETLNNEEDEENLIESANKRRKSSYVLTVIPGRRSSATVQFVKVPRKREERKLSEEEEEEEDNNDIINDETVIISDNEIVQSKGKANWIKRKLASLKKGILIALKNIKCFAKNPVTRLTLITYCSFSFIIIGFDELYSVWCATPIHLGGIGFSLHDISLSLTIVGALSLPFSIGLFPLLERKFGSIFSVQFTLIIQLVSIVLLPNLHFLASGNLFSALWILLCSLMFVIRISTGIGFTATSLFINNSVTPDKLGALNGLSVSLTSLFRCFAPLFAGSIFSASLSNSIGFPFDYHLVFIIFGILLLAVVIMVTRLPKSINKQLTVSES